MSRPSRSDAHLSPVDEATRVAEVREYYDDAAPKRHTKPSRSEHSAVYADALADASHPELDKLQQLEAHTEKLVCEGGKAGEEFVETEYYRDLGCVGKQHHTVPPFSLGQAVDDFSFFLNYSSCKINFCPIDISCRPGLASSRWTSPPAPRSSSRTTRMQPSAMPLAKEILPQTSGSLQLTRCIWRQTSPAEATAENGSAASDVYAFHQQR